MTASPERARSEEALPEDGPQVALLRFGSLSGRLVSPRRKYTEALRNVFGVGLHPLPPEQTPTRHFDLRIEEVEPAGTGLKGSPLTNCLELGGTALRPTLATDALRAELARDAEPIRINLSVRLPDLPFPELCVHFGVVIHKLLFLLDRVILHAAAACLHDTVTLFVGDKGVGKSTICLALARAGGIVLGEDNVVLRRTGAGYRVSGGDERSRLTEQTERHFFAEPLAAPVKDFAGTLKKEIRMRDVGRSRPYEDFPIHRLIFPRVTGRYLLRPLPAQVALLRLMAFNGHFQRFAGSVDQERFLDFLAGFTAAVSSYELTLSHDLRTLEALLDALRHE